MSFLWSHEPELSAEPQLEIIHNLQIDGDAINESAVYQLANGKYLYIRYYGSKSKTYLGITDFEEFETKEEAIEIFKNFST